MEQQGRLSREMANTPAYKVMYLKLKEDIDNNVYPVGTYLPTEGDLEKLFQVSRTTVRHAVDLLAREGRVHVRQGAGTQVVDSPEKFLPKYAKFHNVVDVKTDVGESAIKTKGIWIDRIAASSTVAEALEIGEGAPVFCLQRIIHSNESPMVIMTNYLRTDFFPDLDAYQGHIHDLYYFIQKQYGIQFETGQERITAIRADYLDAQLLDIAPGSPIFFNTRRARCPLGPLEYLEAKIRPDLCTFIVSMQGVPKWYEDAGYLNE